MTEKAPKIHIETPLKNYAFTEHTISKEKKRKRKRRRRNVSFLNGKSVSRMKSFFRAVKCFFLSSLRGLARVHERCKWVTNKNILGKEK